MLGATISTNFLGKFTLESFAWCMFGLDVVRCKPHLIRCCGHDPVQEEGVAVERRVSTKDQSWLILATYQRYRYPSTVSELLFFERIARDILTRIFLHIFRILRVSRAFRLSWQDSPSFLLEICFTLNCRWRATTVTFSVKIFHGNISAQRLFYCRQFRIRE